VVSATRRAAVRFAVPAPQTLLVPPITAAVLSALYGATKIALPFGG
jgi:hypothetical protein